MAELFLARDTGRDALIVIKRILPYLSQEPEFVQMFLDEARIAAQLHHENIVQLYELGHLEGSIFIAMEYLDGPDLRKILQEEMKKGAAIPYAVAAWICARVCEGLYCAHNRVGLDGRPMEIIHRDVSPQNVMVGYDGRVKLVDFGIAKANAYMERSKPGVIKGKFLYLAPEQLSQERLDHRADLFALGTMLYEITTGKSPFYRNTTEAVILSIRSEDPPPPHLVLHGYPMELSRIVMKCLTKDRDRRYQQASEIAKDLDAFCASQTPMAQAHVAGYVSAVFGDEGERTVLHIPPSARPPAGSSLPTQPHSAGRDNEATRVSGQVAPIGRRPTGEHPPPGGQYQEDEPATQMARAEDIKKALGAALAQPAVTPPPQRRISGQDLRAAGGDDLELESTRTVTGGGDASVSQTSPTPSATPSTGPDRPGLFGAPLPDGPVFDTGALPVPRTRPDGLRGPRTSGVRARPGPPVPDGPYDEDEDESTMDYGTLSSAHEDPRRLGGVPRNVVLGAIAAGVLIILCAAVVKAFQSDGPTVEQLPTAPRPILPEPAGGPEAEGPVRVDAEAAEVADAEEPGEEEVEGEEDAVDGPDPEAAPRPTGVSAADLVREEEKRPPPPRKKAVIFRAPRGTRITAGPLRFVAGKTYRLPPGALRVRYDCPGRGGRGTRRFRVSASSRRVQALRIPCRSR